MSNLVQKVGMSRLRRNLAGMQEANHLARCAHSPVEEDTGPERETLESLFGVPY